MKTERFIFLLLALIIFCPLCVDAQTTEFTYQGRLNDTNGTAASYDFEFRLFSAPTAITPLGTQTRLGIPVSGNVFTVSLDFGAQFNGQPRYLEIAVKPAGSSGAYTTLTPRQPLASAPYSIRSLNSTTADTAINSTQLGGIPATRFVQSDTDGNVQISGNLDVGGTLTQPIVNATTEFRIGGQRILSSPIGTDNLFIGRSTGLNDTSSGVANTFVGSFAGRGNTDGIFNTFLGSSAGFSNTTGGENTFLGSNAGRFNTTGNDNTFVGLSAGYNNSTGQRNSYFGKNAGANCPTNNCPSPSTGSDNSFFGSDAGGGNTSGTNNSFFGADTGDANTSGANNSFFGKNAGNTNTSGDNNTVVGSSANVGSSNLNYATAIGAGAVVSTSNTIQLGRISGQERVFVPGLLRLGSLGFGGSTHLCLDGSQQISTCSSLAETNNTELLDTVKNQQTKIEQQQKQIERQQNDIDALKKLVCSQNKTAEICKEQE